MKIKWGVLFVAILGLGLGLVLQAYFNILQINPKPNESHSGQTGLINPLLECNANIEMPPKENELNGELQTYIDEIKSKGEVSQIAVYFKDLNNGPTFGINSNELFSSASLLKVPVMISYLKKMEVMPEVLDQKIKYNSKEIQGAFSQNIDPPQPLTPNQEYTVDNLLYRSIVGSDNIATRMLILNAKTYDAMAVLNDMGIKITLTEDDGLISVRDYASIFRILYNATFLTPRGSTTALDLLSKVPLQEGLREGIPEGVKLAHKYGERETPEGKQFHDCGIVYYEKRPYLLCVMTRGKTSFVNLMDIVGEISEKVYTKIAKP